MEKISIETFRDGIFALRTRRFGNVAEIMIQKMFKLENSNTLNYDKFDNATKDRIEIKLSTVMKANNNSINEDNVIEQILNANVSQRAIKYSEINEYNFDCNIQQVKCDEYDILYYGLFFADKILIFKMSSEQTINCPGYSNKQHRNNEGEGQFHINNKNIEYHLKNHLVDEIDYKKLYNLIK